MCGIAAIFSSTTKSVKGLEDVTKDLMTMTQVRGTDATGIAVVDAYFNLEVHKKAMHASDFLQLQATKKLLSEVDNSYGAIIHCRKKTLGNSGDSAAHPFVVEDAEGVPEFAMVHNGTLTKWNSTKYESDSHWLSQQLYDDHTKALTALNPRCAAALIWTDLRTGKNCFFTNGERPLFYGFLEKADVIIIGSEAELMYAAIKRNNLSLKNNEFFTALPMTLYSMNSDKVTELERTEIKKEVVVQALSQKSLYGANADDEDALFFEEYGYYPARRAVANYPDTRQTMLKNLEHIFKKATGTVETAKQEVATKFTPSNEELKNFEEYTGAARGIEVKGTLEFYDEKNLEAYLNVTDISPMDYQRGLVLGDMVVMRDVSPQYYKYLESSLEKICVCVAGMVDKDSSIKEFVARGRHLRTGSELTDKPRLRLIN